MADLTLYGLKNCDSCRKAMKALQANGHRVSFADIRKEANLAEKLPLWLENSGSDVLINRRSTSWRQLDETARQMPPIDLLCEHPSLIKRPVIEAEDTLYIGWTKAIEAKLIT